MVMLFVKSDESDWTITIRGNCFHSILQDAFLATALPFGVTDVFVLSNVTRQKKSPPAFPKGIFVHTKQRLEVKSDVEANEICRALVVSCVFCEERRPKIVAECAGPVRG